MDKMVLKVKKRISGYIPSELPASSRNSLVGASSSECRQLPERVWPKVTANSF